jgi:hypothetical protein
MKSNLRALLTATALFGFSTAAANARADSKQECAAAYEKTQSLRESGHLLDARKQAVACSASTCSVYVIKDCTQWLAEIDESLPTVVFTAENIPAANPLAVRVMVDGQPITETLDGKLVSLDPGEHVVRFETPGAEAVEQKVTLQAGEKNRALIASFKQAPPPAPPASPPPVIPPPPQPVIAPNPLLVPSPAPEGRSNAAVPPWAWASGGVGMLALGVGAGFGVSALNAQSKLVTACGGDAAHCPAETQATTIPLAEQRTQNRNIFLGFEAAAVVGLGAAVIGIVRSHPKATSPRTGFIVAPFGSLSGGGVGMQGQF